MSGKGGLRKIFNRHALPDEIKEIVYNKGGPQMREQHQSEIKNIMKNATAAATSIMQDTMTGSPGSKSVEKSGITSPTAAAPP